MLRKTAFLITYGCLVAGWLFSVSRSQPWTPREEAIIESAERGELILFEKVEKEDLPSTRPLPYWSILVFRKLFGDSLIVSRLPGLFLGIVALVFLLSTVSRIDGALPAWVSVMVMATCPFFFFSAAMATADIYGIAFSLLAFCFFYYAMFRPAPLYVLPACCCIALNVLSTGITAWLTPVVALTAWGLMTWLGNRGRMEEWTQLKHLIVTHRKMLLCSVSAALGLILAFYLPVYLNTGSQLLEALTTFDTHNHHGGKSEYYVRAFMLGLFPWIILLPLAFFAIFRMNGRGAVDSRMLFAFVWGVAGWSVTSFMIKKYYFFSLPAMPALALAVALVLSRAVSSDRPPWPAIAPWFAAACGCLFLRDMILYSPRLMFEIFLGDESAPEMKGMIPVMVLAGLVFMGVVFAAGRARLRVQGHVVLCLVAAILCFALSMSFSALPLEEMEALLHRLTAA
ncbi:ArnT family glycosyltransferase [Acidobacteriota bacterium]